MDRIAHIENDFIEKFGIPRQSGLVNDVCSNIIFEPQYRNIDSVRGLEGFSHIWLIWGFDLQRSENDSWSPTVRPPRLGGNERMGVFATRSPNRPNPLGLSCVKLLSITNSEKGPILSVAGADLRNNTSIYDIKPYLPFTDSHPEATAGFTDSYLGRTLPVIFPNEYASILSEEKRKTVESLLAQDPRPSYQNDPTRIYGMSFANYNILFRVENETIIVVGITSE